MVSGEILSSLSPLISLVISEDPRTKLDQTADYANPIAVGLNQTGYTPNQNLGTKICRIRDILLIYY